MLAAKRKVVFGRFSLVKSRPSVVVVRLDLLWRVQQQRTPTMCIDGRPGVSLMLKMTLLTTNAVAYVLHTRDTLQSTRLRVAYMQLSEGAHTHTRVREFTNVDEIFLHVFNESKRRRPRPSSQEKGAASGKSGATCAYVKMCTKRPSVHLRNYCKES